MKKTVLAIFPEAAPMWSAAVERLRARLGDRLDVATDVDRGGGRAETAEIILSFALAEESARAATELRWVQALGSGTNGMHLPKGREVMLTSAHGLHAAPVSEAALAMLLALARRLPHAVREQQAARWEPWPSRLLCGSTLGIFGTGEIAGALARKAKAFDMRVIGFSRAPRSLANFDEVVAREALGARGGELDHLVLLAPLDRSTRGIVDAQVIAALKPGTTLVNVGRGELIDEPALLAALQAGRLNAGLDVFAREPLPPESPFWRLPNVLVTPHSAGRHPGYVDDVLDLFLANLDAFERGDISGMRNRVASSGGRE